MEYEASFQLSEGVNMACKSTIMNVNVEEDDEVNFVKDVRARSNACFKCGEMKNFQWDCQYNGDKPSLDSQTPKQTAPDSYDPIVGKWMTNLVATTPVTAKAMQSLLMELNRQKELKRAYRQCYKDMQMTTTSTNTSVMSQPLMSVAGMKTNINSSPVKTTMSQGKKLIEKKKTIKPVDKDKKHVALSATSSLIATTSTVSMLNLRNKLRDKAKVTVAMIQELTEDLQYMDQESLAEEQESVITQESDLEQEDSEEYLTETEDQ